MNFRRIHSLWLAGAALLAFSPAGWAQLSPYNQDFESLDAADTGALTADGWSVFGNVFDSGGGFLFGYGPFGAPNDGANFSAIISGAGGPDQGLQQLSVFSDYSCCAPSNGHFNGTDLVESNVYQEQIISAADLGSEWVFSFEAKAGNLAGATTATAFIKVLDLVGGSFALLAFPNIDMTGLSTEWADFEINLTVDPAWEGQLVQFGFLSNTSNFEPSQNIYDNVNFAPPAPVVTTDIALAGEVLDCTPTCLSFTFLDVESTIDGAVQFDEAAVADGTFDGGNVVNVTATLLNPNEDLFGPSDPPNPGVDNPFTLDQTVNGGGVVVANGQDITNPRGTFTSRMSAGTTDGTDITSGFIDLWLTEGTLAANGAVVTLNYTEDCVDDFANLISVAPCFEVRIFEGLIWVAGGSLGAGPDTDGDGVTDDTDNCTLTQNADQRDTDGDGIGNRCDGDHDNDCNTNFVDLGQFKANFLAVGDTDFDYDGDGFANFVDLGIFKGEFFLNPPGPGAPGNICEGS